MHPLPTVKLGTDFGVVNCPSCGHEVGTERIVPSNKNTTGHCLQCKEWFLIELPIVKKKLVYIDQSLMSDFFRVDDSTERGKLVQSILGKLQQLKARQKVFLVVSDIHFAETTQFPREYADQRKGQLEFQNSMADGRIAGNWCDVFSAQQRRALATADAPECFPSADIGLDDPHRWRVGIKIVLTNTWRGRQHLADPSRSDRNQGILEVITKQVEALGPNANMRDAIEHVRKLWRQDIEGGIASVRKFNELLQSEDWIKAIAHHGSAALPHISDSALKWFVRQIIEGLDERAALEAWLRQLDTGSSCAALRLRVAFEAEVLLRGVQGKPVDPESSGFNKKYGVSQQNDIDHIAAFSPYVDVMTTDNAMRKFCDREMIKEELDKFPCQLFSDNNYPEFENWLDNLLSGAQA